MLGFVAAIVVGAASAVAAHAFSNADEAKNALAKAQLELAEANLMIKNAKRTNNQEVVAPKRKIAEVEYEVLCEESIVCETKTYSRHSRQSSKRVRRTTE